MRFIDDDTVVTGYRHRFIRLQGAFHQRLYGGNVNFGAVFREFIRQPFNVENAVKGVAVNTRIFKRAQRLFAKRTAVDKEENAFKTLGLDQAEHHGNCGAGFTGTGRHRQQDLLLTLDDCLFNRADGIFLIITQAQLTHARVIGKPLILFLRFAAEHFQQLFRAVPLG